MHPSPALSLTRGLMVRLLGSRPTNDHSEQHKARDILILSPRRELIEERTPATSAARCRRERTRASSLELKDFRCYVVLQTHTVLCT